MNKMFEKAALRFLKLFCFFKANGVIQYYNEIDSELWYILYKVIQLEVSELSS